MSPSQLDTPGKPAEIDWKRLRNFLLEQWGVKDEELPRDPKKLSELTSVRLRGAGSGREGEPFPKDFPDLEALKGLVSIKAEGVKINSRPLERVLSRFPQLTTISLKNCGLSKWPNFQQKSTALREIDLSGNGISTLPPSVGALSELRKLDLSDNNLRSLPLGIKLLNNLQELRVRGNPLKELPFYPDALAIAKCDLTQAWNEANPKAPKPASGAYPGEASSAKANGARQDGSKAGAADSATATAAPTPLKKAQTAEESGAGPTDPAEKPNESEPTRASKNPGADAGIAVDAENAALRDFLTKTWKVDPDFLPEADKIGQVTALSMRRERGSVDSNPPDADAAPESIKRLSGLKTLRLEGFVARHPRSISKILDLFPNLESLSLIRCNLPDVPQSALGLSRLVFLDLSGNNLYRLPKSFGDLQKLRFLKLTGNNLTGVPALFRRMPALEAIDLSRNKVLSFPDAVKDRIKPLPRIAVERMRWDMGCALPDSSEEAPKQAPSAPRAEPAPSAKERAEEAIQEEGKFVKVVGSSPSGQRIPLKAAKQLPEQRQRPAEDPKSQAGAEASQARANEEQKAATPATPEQPAPKPAQAQTQAQGADGDKAQAEHEAAAPAPTPDQPEQSEQTGPEPNADGEQKTATPATQKQLTPEQTPAPAQAQAQAQAQGAEDDKALAAPEASAPAPSPAQPEQSEQAGPEPDVDGEQKTATPTAQEQSAPEQTPAPAQAQSQAKGAESDKTQAEPEAAAPAPSPAQPEQSKQARPEPNADGKQKTSTPTTQEQQAPEQTPASAQAQAQAEGAESDKTKAEPEAPAPSPAQPEQSEQAGPEPDAGNEPKTATPATQEQSAPEQTPAPAQAQSQAEGAESDKTKAEPEAPTPEPTPAQPEQSKQAGHEPDAGNEPKTATPATQEQPAPEQTPAPVQSRAQGAEGDKAQDEPKASAPAPTPAQPEQSKQARPEPNADGEPKTATPTTQEQPAPEQTPAPAQAQAQAEGVGGDKAQAEPEASAPTPTPAQPEQSEQAGPKPIADGEQKTATPATQEQPAPEQTPAPAQALAQAQGAESDKAKAVPEAAAPEPTPAQPEQTEQSGSEPNADGEPKTSAPATQEQPAPEQTPAPAQAQAQAQGAEGDKAEAVPEASAPAPTPAQPEQSEQSGPEPAGGEAQPQRHAAPSDEELTVQPGPATSPNETPAGAGGNAAPPASVGQARPAPIEGAPSPDEALTVEFAPASAPEPTPAAEPEPAANGAKSEIGPEANVETPTEKKEERKAGKEEEAEEKQAPAKQTPKGENAGASPAEAAPKPDRRDWMRPKTELSVEVGPSRVKPKNAFSLFKPFSASPYAHRYRSFYDNPAQALPIAPAGGLAAYVYGFNESSPDFNARREKELTAGVETLLIDEGNRDRMLALLPAMESLKTLVLETDDVPEEIRLAPQLEKLYIRIPLLESLPNAIGAMVNLKRLSITQHRLDSLPDSFSRLESLESLDLRTDFGARYRFLPSNVLLLPKLKTLKIGSFAFVGPYGAEIPDLGGRVPSVERLIVSKCSIGEAPPRFERLGALKILELNGGDLYGGLDWLHLGEMPELRELRLIDLPCSALPAGLAELKNLERLVLSRLDKIDDFGEGLGELSALRELVVDRCPAPALPLGIARLERLRSLTIRGCPNLRKLPAGLTALKNLRELCAVDSGLTALPDRIWDMPSLRKLDASGNQIGYLPDDLSRSRSLRDVDVSGNPFDNPFKELEKLLPLLSRLNAPAAGVGPLKAPNPAVWGRIGKGDALALEPENAEALREFGEELGLRFGFEGARAFGALGAVRELSLSVAPDGRDWTALGRLFPRVEKLNLLRYAHGPRRGDFAPPSAFPSVKELWLYCQDSEPCPLPEGLGDMPFLRALRLTVPHGLDGESSKMLGRLSQEGALKAETLILDGKWDSAPPDFVRGMTGVKALDMHDAGARFAAPWLSEWDNLEAARLKLKGSPQDIQPLLTHPGLKRVSLCVTSWDKAWDELFDGDWVERCGWEFLEIFADRIGKIGAGLARMRSLRNLRLDAKSIGVVEEGALNGPSLETLDAQGPAIGDAPNALVSYRLALAKGEKISWGDCRRERKAKPAR